ncbi:2TM domain-containing protein [Aquimarina sp. TRL1]|uniref:2TM domain-containing protein n=1 Tax=Aquimarina sp. (strain TRL1) TaxID=2736252 RepID=UPI00158D3DDF|nr:2TM domain-containing protein [Aquimarina sp. TRL1]QKX05260.1 2TM domain-containing protein [Aquimarina sp. TRL1]
MFSRKKEIAGIDPLQRELYEHARKRVVQKKRLFQHFVIFIVGSLFLIIFNLVLGFGKEITFLDTDWFVFAILFWSFLFVLHFCNVWLFSKFMGKDWTDRQMERLIAEQKKEIAQIQREVDLMHPKEELLKKKEDLMVEKSQKPQPPQTPENT